MFNFPHLSLQGLHPPELNSILRLYSEPEHDAKNTLKPGRYKIAFQSTTYGPHFVAAAPNELAARCYNLLTTEDNSSAATWIVYPFEEDRKQRPLYKIVLDRAGSFVCTGDKAVQASNLLATPENFEFRTDWGIDIPSNDIGFIYQWNESDRDSKSYWSCDYNPCSPVTLSPRPRESVKFHRID